MARKLLVGALPLLACLASCQTPSGSFCTIAKPIRPTAETIAVMSDAEVRDVLAHNEKLTKLCGIKP